MPRIGAGRLSSRVTFQREIQLPDTMGGFVRSWGGDLTVSAAFVPERGSEAIAAGRLSATMPGVLTIRSSIAARKIDPTWRVMLDGVPHQIRAISNPDQVNEFLDVVVERGVGT